MSDTLRACGTCLTERNEIVQHEPGIYPHAGIILPSAKFEGVHGYMQAGELVDVGRYAYRMDPTLHPRYADYLRGGMLRALARWFA